MHLMGRMLVALVLSSSVLSGCLPIHQRDTNKIPSISHSDSTNLVLPEILGSETERFYDAWREALLIRHGGKKDVWQTPKETERYGGACRDIAPYLANKLQKRDIYSRVVFGKEDRNDEEYHAWVEVLVNGNLYVADASFQLMIIKKDVPDEKYIEFPMRPEWLERTAEVERRMKRGE